MKYICNTNCNSYIYSTLEINRHFIKEKLDAGIIMLPFVRSEDQLADVLTKAVSNNVFSNSLDKLGMRDIFAPT